MPRQVERLAILVTVYHRRRAGDVFAGGRGHDVARDHSRSAAALAPTVTSLVKRSPSDAGSPANVVPAASPPVPAKTAAISAGSGVLAAASPAPAPKTSTAAAPAPAAPASLASEAGASEASASAPASPAAAPAGDFSLQFGAFLDAAKAKSLIGQLAARGYSPASVDVADGYGQIWHYVRFGGFADEHALRSPHPIFCSARESAWPSSVFPRQMRDAKRVCRYTTLVTWVAAAVLLAGCSTPSWLCYFPSGVKKLTLVTAPDTNSDRAIAVDLVFATEDLAAQEIGKLNARDYFSRRAQLVAIFRRRSWSGRGSSRRDNSLTWLMPTRPAILCSRFSLPTLPARATTAPHWPAQVRSKLRSAPMI